MLDCKTGKQKVTRLVEVIIILTERKKNNDKYIKDLLKLFFLVEITEFCLKKYYTYYAPFHINLNTCLRTNI